MPIEKVLSRIRSQINDSKALLELFSDTTLQPGVEDCERLQKNLNALLEQVAVYKYSKQQYELSPSFNLHAHISEKTVNIPVDDTPVPEAVKAPEPVRQAPEPTGSPELGQEEKATEKYPDTRSETKPPVKQLKPLHIGLNDKFRFINELFAKNNAEYHIAVEQLSNLQTWAETDLYLNSLKNLYGWKDQHDAVKYFFSLIKKRFQ